MKMKTKQQILPIAIGAAVGAVAGTLLYLSTNNWGGLVTFPVLMGYAFLKFSNGASRPKS